jgi:tetratricopeptide (TPR) repeat protein
MYIFDGQYARADSVFERLIFQSDATLRRASRLYAVYPSVYQGKFSEALRKLDDLTGLYDSDTRMAREADPINHLARKLKAMVLEEMGRLGEAKAEMRRCLSVPAGFSAADSAGHLGYYIKLLVESGEATLAKDMIEQRVRALGKDGPKDRILRYMSAMAAFGHGDFDRAADLLGNDLLSLDDFAGQIYLARTFLGAGRFQDAERLLRAYDSCYISPRAFNGIESVKIHYYLGLTLEQMNLPKEAIEQYSTYVRILKDAQPVTASLEDAHRRLDSLQRIF